MLVDRRCAGRRAGPHAVDPHGRARFAAGEDAILATHVEDAWKTMALVEAAYRAARAPATPIPDA